MRRLYRFYTVTGTRTIRLEKMMKKPAAITCVFLDIGGVLLTDGWDHLARRRAAKRFRLEWAEMELRHDLNFATYEEGKLTLDAYLDRVVFDQRRTFSRGDFQRFMFAQSKPYSEMIALASHLKHQLGLKVIVVSNEARELNAYRIRQFKLDGFVDAFVSSCYVHLRKPDEDIFRLALDVAQAAAAQVVFIDNTPLFVRIAEGLGIRGIVHKDYLSTRARLAELGIQIEPDLIEGNHDAKRPNGTKSPRKQQFVGLSSRKRPAFG